MGISDVTHGCEPGPTHIGLNRPAPGKAGSTLALFAALLLLFGNVNMALGASFVLQDGKRVDGEIIYASASSVIIRTTNGATAQLGRHTIERVKLATDDDAVLEGVLKSWKEGVYEISNDSGIFQIKAQKIISKRQISSQEVAVTTEEKQQDNAVAVTQEKDEETATATTEEEPQEVAVATTGDKAQEIIIKSVEEKENAKNLTFNLALSKPAKQKVLLIYSTEDGTALAGSDYEAKRGSVVLQPGTTNTTVSVTLLDDDLAEGDETFGLLVTSDLDLAAVRVSRGSATILDNEKQAAKQ